MARGRGGLASDARARALISGLMKPSPRALSLSLLYSLSGLSAHAEIDEALDGKLRIYMYTAKCHSHAPLRAISNRIGNIYRLHSLTASKVRDATQRESIYRLVYSKNNSNIYIKLQLKNATLKFSFN